MQLKPVLGPVQLVFYSVGVIIGAGVYSVIGAAAGIAQQSLWLSFLIGAFVALLTGLSYAEMATAFPHAGAEYVYLRRALPKWDWAAFSVGIVILLGGAATAATVAVAFGGYLRVFVDVPVTLAAVILLLSCTAFNIWGMEESSWVNIVLTSVEVTGLLIVIAAGLTRDGMIQPLVATPQPGVLTAAAVLFFVYLGFEEIANMTEEVRSPARDLPPAIVISIGVTTLLYVLVSLAVVTLAAPAELAGSAAPLALAIEKAWPGAGQLVSAIALFATANTVLITLIATSRLAFSMSRDGEIPRIFGKVLPHRHTPWAAAVLTLAMSAVLIPIGNVKILAEFSSFSALLAFFAVNISLIVLRYRLPEHHRPFRLPLSIGRMPLLPLLAIASICLLLANFESDIYVAGAIVLMLTILVSLLRKYRPRRPSAKR
jgi:amino acid transporter